jgi:hypothetical protein
MKICRKRCDVLWHFSNFPTFSSKVMPASIMQNEAAASFGRSVYVYRATWCHIPEECKLHIYHIRIWRLRFRMCSILTHVSFPFLLYSSFPVKGEILFPSFFSWPYYTPGLHKFRPPSRCSHQILYFAAQYLWDLSLELDSFRLYGA